MEFTKTILSLKYILKHIQKFFDYTIIYEFTALEHKFKRWFCTQKPVLNVRFKDLWNTKINLTQIWYDKFK